VVPDTAPEELSVHVVAVWHAAVKVPLVLEFREIRAAKAGDATATKVAARTVPTSKRSFLFILAPPGEKL
jgi:hypothetical protein